MKKYPVWYLDAIEGGLREIVYKLRNNGINTTCSCGHGRWIQCASFDPTSEIPNVNAVLLQMKIKSWRILVTSY